MERYKLEIVNDHGDRYIRCEPAPDGSWVMFKDVTALEARIAELEAALRRIIRMLDHAAIGQHLVHMRKASSIAIAALEGGKKDE